MSELVIDDYSIRVLYSGNLPLAMGQKTSEVFHEPLLPYEIIERVVPEDLWGFITVEVDDGQGNVRVIPPEEWDDMPIPNRSQVMLTMVPGELATILAIIYWVGVVMTVLSIVMTIYSLTRGSPKQATVKNSPSVTGARNNANPGGIIPRIYGRTRVFPYYAAQPYQEVIGDDVYLNCLFSFGFGPNKLSELRIGDTDIGNYTNCQVEIREGWSTDDPITLYTTDVSPTDQSIELVYNTPTILTTADNTDEVIINLMWDEGLVQISKKGDEKTLSVSVLYEYRDHNVGGVWTTFNTLASQATSLPESSAPSGEMYVEYTIPSAIGNQLSITLSCPTSWTSSSGTTTGITEMTYSVSTVVSGGTQPPAQQYGGEFYTWTDNDGILASQGAGAGYVVVPAGQTRTIPLSTVQGVGVKIRVTLSGVKWTGGGSGIGGNSGSARPFPAPSAVYSVLQAGARTYVGRKLGTSYDGERFRFPSRGKWDVRITRQTEEYTDLKEKDTVHLIAFNSVTYTPPVSTSRVLGHHTLVALRIKATDQLTGIIDTFSAVAESVLYCWNGSAWVQRATRNPAWAFVDILTGPANAKRRSRDRIDLDTVYPWAQQCDSAAPQNTITGGVQATANEPYHLFDGVFDQDITVMDALKNVCDAGRAELAMVNGLYGVVQDIPRTTFTQYITPLNSWDFKGTKKFTANPEALRVGWRNPNLNYEQAILTVYEDGQDSSNTHDFEDYPLMFGVERQSQVWRNSRYKLAKNRLEKERFSVMMDIEHIRCTKGDLVYLQHDVVRIGISSGLIESVTRNGAGYVSGVTFDRVVPMEAAKSYGIRIRMFDITEYSASIITVEGDQTSVTFVTPYNDSGKTRRGDLFIFGETDLIGEPVIVEDIKPQSELQAELTLRPYNTNVYTADGGTLPANAITNGRDPSKAPGPVGNLSAVENIVYIGTGAQSNIIVTWNPPSTGGFPQYYELYTQTGTQGQFKKEGSAIVGTRYVLTNVALDVAITIKVLAIGSAGNAMSILQATSVTITPDGDVDQPDQPNNVDCQSMAGAVLVRWTNPTGLPDLVAVKVYASTTNDFTTASLVGQATTTPETNSGQFMHYTGIGGIFRYYWVTAVDSSDNESEQSPGLTDGVPGTSLALAEFNPFPQVFWDPFDAYTTETDILRAWSRESGSGELSVSTLAADGVDGNKALVIGNSSGDDSALIVAKQSVSFDPTKLYRIQAFVRDKVSTTGTMYIGVAGRNASDSGWVNSTGANSLSSQHALAASGRDPTSSYTIYTGYFLGRNSVGTTGEATDPTVPGKLHTDARYFRPFIQFSTGGTVGQVAVDMIRVDIVDDLSRSAFDLAASASDTADGKIASWYQTTPPTDPDVAEGDLWFDTDDGNKIYRYNGTSWVVSQDSGIGEAINDAATAQATADGKIVTFVTTNGGVTPPTGASTGDLWFDTQTRQLRRYKVGVGTTLGFEGGATGSPLVDNFTVYLTSAPATNLLVYNDPGFSNPSANAQYWTFGGSWTWFSAAVPWLQKPNTADAAAITYTAANLVDGQNYTFKFDHDLSAWSVTGLRPFYYNTLGNKVYLANITNLSAVTGATYSFTAVNPIQNAGGGGWNEIVSTYNIGNLADKNTVGTGDIDNGAVQTPILSETTSSVSVAQLPSYTSAWSMNFTTVAANIELEFFFSAYASIPNNGIQGTNASLYARMYIDGVLRTVPFPTDTRMQGLREMDEGSDESVFLMWHAPVTISTAGSHTIDIQIAKGDTTSISVNNRRIWAMITKGK